MKAPHYEEMRYWLPDMDLNHDKQIQSLLCYRYTIGQTGGANIGFPKTESSYYLALRTSFFSFS